MRVNPYVYGFLSLVVFVGLIFGAKAAGAWSISGKVTSTGEQIVATGANVDEIKGWMKIGDVATAYNVPLAELLKQFGLPADTSPDKQLKELESGAFSVTGLRTWLAERAKK